MSPADAADSPERPESTAPPDAAAPAEGPPADLPSLLTRERRRIALEHVLALDLPPGARVLDLNRGLGAAAQMLRGRGLEVTDLAVPPDAVDLGLPQAAFDVALALDVIGRLRWDRWTLQQVHRALRPDGHLLLTASNLLGLPQLLDPAYLAGRARKQVRARMRRPPAGAAGPGARGERGYLPARLRRLLEDLGYEIRDAREHGYGPGWTRPGLRRVGLWIDRFYSGLRGSGAAALLADLGGEQILLCRALPSLFGLDPRRPFPDPEAHRRRFETKHRRLVEIRDAWLAAHPQHRPRAAEPLSLESASGARVLVLAPHPDDEIIGCGGTLLDLVQRGAAVTVVYATDGSLSAGLEALPPEQRSTARLEQARAVAREAGIRDLVVWGAPQAAGLEEEERAAELAALLEKLRPALAFVPFLTDLHPDHVALARVLARALERAPVAADGLRVLSYQVWSLAPVHLFHEVTDRMRDKERLLFLYPTEMGPDDYVHDCADLHFQDACHLMGKPGYAEAFFALEAGEYRRLVAARAGPGGHRRA